MITTFSSLPVMLPELNMWYLKLFKGLGFYHLLPPRATYHFLLSNFDLIFFKDLFFLLFLTQSHIFFIIIIHHHIISKCSTKLTIKPTYFLVSTWICHLPIRICHLFNIYRAEKEGKSIIFCTNKGAIWFFDVYARPKNKKRGGKVQNSVLPLLFMNKKNFAFFISFHFTSLICLK